MSVHGGRQTYLDRQDLGAVHLPDDSTTEEGHSCASTTRDHLLKAHRQHEHRAAAADALHIGVGQLLQAVLARPLSNAGLLRLAHLHKSHFEFKKGMNGIHF